MGLWRNERFGRRLSVALPLLALCCDFTLYSAPASGTVSEYEVKAAFIYNLVKFVEWPAGALSGGSFNLCVAEPDPFGEALPAFLRQKQVFGHSVEVVRLKTSENYRSCHALFISMREARSVSGSLRDLQRAPVLTIGESADFGETGGMMSLLLVNGKIQLHINTQAVRAANLRISAQLLRLANHAQDGGRK
ncbi:MAG: YfiR family protein [Bryobacteraceae bacterium]|nr:YfiR family protein [Bryobacteraceae bacterium]